MSIVWLSLTALAALLGGVVYVLSVRPPRCPVCRIAADLVSERTLNSWPAIIEAMYRCPRCKMALPRDLVGDVFE